MLPWTILSVILIVCADLCFAKGVFSVHNYRHVPVSRNSATVRRVGNVYVFPYYSATRRRIYRCGYGAARLGCCAGWKRNSVAGTCTPICEDGCVHGTCVSPNQCRCDPGYTGSNCNADLNECGLEPRPCNQRCINTHGSYRCHCEQGYLLEEDGKTCIRDGRCRPGMCAYGCRKIGYRVECICPAGLDVAADGYHCVDIDECATGAVRCPADQRCVNTYGNFMCLCQEGYIFRYINGKMRCTESEDRCLSQGLVCDSNASCKEGTGGVPECVCNDGYMGNGEECTRVQIKDCNSNPCYYLSVCSPLDLDLRTMPVPEDRIVKMYQCAPCPRGYSGDGETCQDIDECAEGTSLCSPDADCTNTQGSYRCVCREGFTGNGFICDALGCTLPGYLSNGIYLPPPSSSEYEDGDTITFQCNIGYRLQGAVLSRCVRGMWTAAMPQCIDVDECQNGDAICHEDATCINVPGSYRCRCNPGFTGSGVLCFPLTCAVEATVPNGMLLPPLPADGEYDNGVLVNFVCNDGFLLVGALTSRCVQGEWSSPFPQCVDDDECQSPDSNDCDENANCINVPGSFLCECREGYFGNGRICLEVDPTTCADLPCAPNVVCTDLVREVVLATVNLQNPAEEVITLYKCGDCPDGYRGDGIECINVDECAENTFECNVNARCVDLPGTYMCECNPGFYGDGNTCVAISPLSCADKPCFEGVECTDLDRGVVLGAVDLNNPPDVISLFLCGDCPEGYVGDGITCTDVDECAQNLFDCDINARCVNEPGSYSCECNIGFYGDGRTCVAINPTSCADQPCFPGVACTDLDRAEVLAAVDLDNPPLFISLYQCGECPPGYTGDGIDCEDVDECAQNLFDCDINARCVNGPGSYSCECNIGFYGDGRTCVAINPTSCADQPCFPGVACTDLDRAEVLAAVDLDNPPLFISLFQCGDCPPGYTGDGIDCEDVDECAQNLFDCDINARCVNEPGSYSCECNIGFYGDGRTCVAINPTSCADQPCFPGVACTDLDRAEVLAAVDLDNPPLFISLFQCGECPPGYTGDGIDCEDVDECAQNLFDCDINARCVNEPGSYSCECNIGFYGDGRTCVAINPTSCADQPCFPGVACTDLDRAEVLAAVDLDNPPLFISLFQCGECPPGYTGDGIDCEDVDECVLGTHDCDTNAECSNTPGSFVCVCNRGFYGDGRVCIPIDPTRCIDRPCFDNVICTDLTRGEVVGSIDLNNPVDIIYQYRCGPCPPGYRGDGKNCVDIDECAEGTFECHPNATCVNIPGSFECVCNVNFHGDGKVCIPLDLTVCAADGPCFDGVKCTNLTRSDVLDEIDLATFSPEELIKFYNCGDCPLGYMGDGEVCIDIDECDTGDFDCHRNASCENEIGGYTCVCIAGHFGNGTHCAQLDNRSCADNPCFAGVECTDIDPMDVDFTQPFVRLFECGECPEDYSGDGIECTLDYIPPNVNLTVVVVDHSDPLDELPAPDADVAAYVADPTQPRGTLRVASAVAGPDGVVTIEVPYNRTVIVTAGRPANDLLFRDRGLDNSMTVRAHRHIRNVVTIPLAVREEMNTFLWKSSSSNEFAFSGNEGGSSYRVGIPAKGIRVVERRQVTIEFYGVNITIPEAFEHAPELLAMIREGGGLRGDILSSSADSRVKLVPLEVVGVMELSVFQRGRRPVSIAPSNPVTLQIPISKLPPDLSVGDRLDAWYYDEESAVWLKDGSGLIVQDPNTNELLWTYEATHFTWWAAGRPMSAEQSCVSVKACQDSACTMPVPGTRLRLVGEDFGYIRSRITDRDGHACFPFKYTGSVTVEAVCAMERASVVSTTLPAECERAESDIPPSELDPNVPSEACREVTLVLPPLAANLVCNDPGEVDLTTRYLAGDRYGDSVQYTCPPEQVPDVADGYRTCLECGLWSGSPVNCVENFFKKRRRRSYLPGGQ